MRSRNVSHMVARPRAVASIVPSGTATPASSRWPSAQTSAYPSEDEGISAKPKKPFRFLDLPSELRDKIYDYISNAAPEVLDLDPDNYRLIHKHITPVFLVSRRINDEAAYRFYSKHTIRIFPCHPGRFFKTKKPLLARLSPRVRAAISTLELRLGPGFAAPPKGWVINEALGLEDCKNVRVLKVIVQIDPSEPMFQGYRRGENNFYEKFSADLLEGVLETIGSIREVQFDAYEGVGRHGNMMSYLLDTVRLHEIEETGKPPLISWGPNRKWKDEVDEELKDAMTESVLIGPLTGLTLASPSYASISVFG